MAAVHGRAEAEAQAQAALPGIALELVAITERLQRVHDALPSSRDCEAMLEHRVPYDVATELAGTVECVIAGSAPAGDGVARVGVARDGGGLREQHREQQALLRRLRGRMRDESG